MSQSRQVRLSFIPTSDDAGTDPIHVTHSSLFEAAAALLVELENRFGLSSAAGSPSDIFGALNEVAQAIDNGEPAVGSHFDFSMPENAFRIECRDESGELING